MENDTRNLFDVVILRVEDIDPDPEQPRREMRKIPELARSMSEYGQLHPISVRAIGNRYRIIGGERRWTAAKSLGWPEIAAYVATTDDAETALLELADNLHDPLTPEERDQGTQRTFAFDVPVERIAAAAGYDAGTVSRARRTFDAVGDPVKASMMSLDQLAAADEFADDPEAYQRIIDAKPDEWKRVVRAIRQPEQAPAPQPMATGEPWQRAMFIARIEDHKHLKRMIDGDVATILNKYGIEEHVHGSYTRLAVAWMLRIETEYEDTGARAHEYLRALKADGYSAKEASE